MGQRGVFWDGDTAHPWLVLAHQLAGVAAISGWAVAWSGDIPLMGRVFLVTFTVTLCSGHLRPAAAGGEAEGEQGGGAGWDGRGQAPGARLPQYVPQPQHGPPGCARPRPTQPRPLHGAARQHRAQGEVSVPAGPRQPDLRGARRHGGGDLTEVIRNITNVTTTYEYCSNNDFSLYAVIRRSIFSLNIDNDCLY